uniref:Replication protein A 70 kDa DNA-binding subunit B/D first OB fold domain-containing protein n=1 Tax=Brassica oleracea TaxID=3712 RepID=A0A3P6B0H1_BRAOL|nr:unnamed protein product [Brassica oleracea]
MASFSSVTDLKPFKSMWKIRVRIIRLWKQYSAAGGLTIEMVVVDSNMSLGKLLKYPQLKLSPSMGKTQTRLPWN